MTRKELVDIVISDIGASCDVALPPASWADKAEDAINDAFHISRSNRRSVVAFACDLLSASSRVGNHFSRGMDIAICEILGKWYCWGWLNDNEVDQLRKIAFFDN